MDYISPQLLKILAGYVPFGLITLTIICACFIIYIYSQEVFNKVSATFYLKAMAIFDSLQIFQTLAFSLPFGFGIELKTLSNFACQILFFASYSFHNITTWCEALVSLDRCIQIKYRGKYEIFSKCSNSL